MTFIPARPIVADDPLAYFSALNAPKNQPQPVVRHQPATQALDLMFGYYTAD